MSSYTCVKGAICFTICLCISQDLDGYTAPRYEVSHDMFVWKQVVPDCFPAFHDLTISFTICSFITVE